MTTTDTEPTRWRKKPVEIEAVQFTGHNYDRIASWMGDAATTMTSPDGTLDLHIETLEGTLHVSPDDWVIRGVQGEFYPCKTPVKGPRSRAEGVSAPTTLPTPVASLRRRSRGLTEQTCLGRPSWRLPSGDPRTPDIFAATYEAAEPHPVARVELFTDTTGDHHWRAIARNGEIVATCGEGYRNAAHARAMAERILPGVEIRDEETNRG